MQGYAAREFAKQGVKPGELAIISKEAVSILNCFLAFTNLIVNHSCIAACVDFILEKGTFILLSVNIVYHWSLDLPWYSN